MKNTTRSWHIGLGVALVGTLAFPGSARADDTREKELADRVEQLEKQLKSIQEGLRGGIAAGFSSELEARVAELEAIARKDKGGLGMYWSNGLRMKSADGKTSFKFGGRIQTDFASYDADSGIKRAVGQVNSGSRFRRARLYMAGTVYKNVDFKAQYDFAGGGPGFRDVWIGFKNLLPFGYVKVGHQFEPFGLEEQTSSKYITFMERSVVTALQPGRNTGISVSDVVDDGNLTWKLGVFRNTNGVGDDRANKDSGEWNATARITHMGEIADESGQPHFYHLGAAYSMRTASNDRAGWGSGGESSLAPALVGTGTLGIDDSTVLGLEAAYVAGPLSVQGEYTVVKADGTGPKFTDLGGSTSFVPGPSSSSRFDAWAAQISYFLTGESRPYDKKNGVFGRVSPKNNHGEDGSYGALELAARISEIDLNDGPVRGGQMDVITVGLNWYLNPVTRIMLNIGKADVKHVGDLEFVQLRFQIDW